MRRASINTVKSLAVNDEYRFYDTCRYDIVLSSSFVATHESSTDGGDPGTRHTKTLSIVGITNIQNVSTTITDSFVSNSKFKHRQELTVRNARKNQAYSKRGFCKKNWVEWLPAIYWFLTTYLCFWSAYFSSFPKIALTKQGRIYNWQNLKRRQSS